MVEEIASDSESLNGEAKEIADLVQEFEVQKKESSNGDGSATEINSNLAGAGSDFDIDESDFEKF